MKEKMINYEKLVDESFDELVNDLLPWVKIPSIYDASTITKQTPYGKNVDLALEYVAKLGEKYGYDVDRCNGYCTELTIGNGKEIVMIMGHGDVVPTGSGWDQDPFLGEIVDNTVYGRGSWDDKGPTLAAFHALNILKKTGRLNKNKTYKLVVGGDEERGSSCLAYYFNKLNKPNPTYGFTPDANFPLIYGEKGILTYAYIGVDKSNLIELLSAGTASNAVIDNAKIILTKELNLVNDFNEYLKQNKLKGKYSQENGKTTIELTGKGAHASTPHLGVNALIHLLNFLNAHVENPIFKHFAPLFNGYYGEGMGLSFDGPKMGKLTMNLGLGKVENGKYSFTLNIRYPIDTSGSHVKEVLDLHVLDEGVLNSDAKPLFIDPNSPFIKALLSAYQEVSNDYESKPMVIGGGTYAKSTINSVAYGMAFKHSVDAAHQANESLDLDDLKKGTLVYLIALDKLGNL